MPSGPHSAWTFHREISPLGVRASAKIVKLPAEVPSAVESITMPLAVIVIVAAWAAVAGRSAKAISAMTNRGVRRGDLIGATVIRGAHAIHTRREMARALIDKNACAG